jgi:hypothetical protein
METWQEKSHHGNQIIISVLSAIVGFILIVKFYSSVDFNDIGSAPGFMLGIFIFVLGMYLLIMDSNQEIIIDPGERLIKINNTNRFHTKNKTIAFDEIADIKIGYLGKKTNFIENYYLVLILKNDKECSLFGPGFYGINKKYLAQERKDRLWKYLKNTN